MTKSVGIPNLGNKTRFQKIVVVLICFIATLLIIAFLTNFNTIIHGVYKTNVNYGDELQSIVIKIPDLSIKWHINEIVHPPKHIFYTFHKDAYVEDFFNEKVFNRMSKIDYGYENKDFAIEDFKIQNYKVFCIIPITKYSFSYRGV